MSDLALFITVGENGAAVLSAHIGALPVLGRGVVHAVEKFDELAVCDDGRVKGYLESFGICIWRSAIIQNCHFFLDLLVLVCSNGGGVVGMCTYGQSPRYTQTDMMATRSSHHSTQR